MRCLITGVDGFLGANLAKHLRAQGHEVTGAALSRKHGTSLDALNVNIRVEYGDITDAAYVDRLVNAYEPEWVAHLAAVSIVRVASNGPARALQTNILGTVNLLEACRSQPSVKAVVVASSDKAYGDQGGVPYREEMALKPTGAYEVSKAAADSIALLYGRQYGVPAMVIRCANLVGPGDLNWSRLVPNSCRKALKGQPPVLYAGAWAMKREWLDVDGACDAYRVLFECGKPGEAYNAGSGFTSTPGETATAIADIAQAPAPVTIGEPSFYEIPAQCLDSSKLQALGWQSCERWPLDYQYILLKGIVAWYRQYLQWSGL